MARSKPRKLLLSSVWQPFGQKYGDGFGTTCEGSHQLMWAQGVFRTRATTTQWGIDFIAANLEVPTTTLHYPTRAQFVAELENNYDYVGIAFVPATQHKMAEMTRAIRQHAPSSQIILGGYGTALADEFLPQVDHICRGEGVAFMRDLLGEPVDAPIEQPLITQATKLFSVSTGRDTGYVFAGLGCPNGCDFCATSHYFRRKHIRLLPDGRSILHAIQRMRDHFGDMRTFCIIDEDFLLNEARGREFLEAVRGSDLPALSLNVFASVKALSRFSAAELVEMGVDIVWIGFEGMRTDYAKMSGRSYRDLFADLHSHGISVLASMIIGFDYQTPEIIWQEFEELIGMRPSMCQFLIYGPVFGTPAYHRLKSEGRVRDEVYREASKHDGFSLGFDHPHMRAEEIEAIQRQLYKKAFERLGPGVLRVPEDWLAGFLNLRDHPAPRVRAKASHYGDAARRALQMIPASKRYVSSTVRDWAEEFQQRLLTETGPLGSRERLVAHVVAPVLLRITDMKLRLGLGDQPEPTRRTFRMGDPHITTAHDLIAERV
ncbi:B12-binding domain-containing radical SAM protein [Myxococcota bacterium]